MAGNPNCTRAGVWFERLLPTPSQSDSMHYKGGSHPSGSAMEKQFKRNKLQKAHLFYLSSKKQIQVQLVSIYNRYSGIFPNPVTDSPFDGENHLILKAPKQIKSEKNRQKRQLDTCLNKNWKEERKEGKMNSWGPQEEWQLRGWSAAVNNMDIQKSLPLQTIWRSPPTWEGFLMRCHGNTATQYPYTRMNSFQKQTLPGFDNCSSAKCRHARTKDNPEKSVVCYTWDVKWGLLMVNATEKKEELGISSWIAQT